MAEPTIRGRALVVGVYMSDRPHIAVEAAVEFGRSREWTVDQRWIALGRTGVSAAMQHVTVGVRQPPVSKFSLINSLIAETRREAYDYIVISDDDVGVPATFLDEFLDVVVRHDFAVAQPARTRDSSSDHCFVSKIDGIRARWTRFVEIGPLVVLRADAVPLLVPFDEDSPMGWGYDFIWPIVIEAAGLRMGIVDATPVEHKMRPSVTLYSAIETRGAMDRLLARQRHLTRDEACVVIEAYA